MKQLHGNRRLSRRVRKISAGEGVERTFQTYSPMLAAIEIKRRGDVRLSERSESARIEEKLAARKSEDKE